MSTEKDGYICIMKLLRSEVEYDVDFISWKTAQCRITENMEQRGEAQTDKENADWLTRQMELAVESVKRAISAYLNEHFHYAQTDELKRKDEYVVILRMERGWRGDVKRMNTFFHKYVVESVLAEWFGMVMPNEQATHVASADYWFSELVKEARKVVIESVIFRL